MRTFFAFLAVIVSSVAFSQTTINSGIVNIGVAPSSGGGGGGGFAGKPGVLAMATNSAGGGTLAGFNITNTMTVSGSNCWAFWMVSMHAAAGDITTCMVDGNSTGVQLWTNSFWDVTGADKMKIFYLSNAPAGSHTFAAVLSADVRRYLMTMLATNVSGVDVPGTNFANVLSISNIVASAANELMVMYSTYSDQLNTGTPTPFAGQTVVGTNYNVGDFYDLITTKGGTAGTSTNGITYGSQRNQGLIVGGIKGF